jgi:hypothetical protein
MCGGERGVRSGKCEKGKKKKKNENKSKHVEVELGWN